VEAVQTVLILAVIAAGVLVAIWYTLRLEAKRREALFLLAQSLELTYRGGPDASFDTFHTHAPFQIGRHRRARNLLEGETTIANERHPVTLGDYEYTVRRDKRNETKRFSFALFRLPWPAVPDLAIRHEHLGDKILGAIGFDDIDFESEEFSRRFFVKSPDKRFAYAVVHPQMMEFLLDGQAPKVLLHHGECLVYVSEQKRWAPDEFRRHFDWGRDFLERWPDHLRRELSERGSRGGPA
jgi:hypothetical protein